MTDSIDNNSSATETAIEALSLEVKEDFVDPWNVSCQSDTGIDYDKLIRKKNYRLITQFNDKHFNTFWLGILFDLI